MPLFDDAISAAVAGRTIMAAPLGFFDFRDQPMRLWPGFGNVTAGGYTWTGMGDLVAIDGLSSQIADAAQQVTFTLTGVTAQMQAIAKDQQNQVSGRSVIIYAQFFDAATMAALGGMLSIWAGDMDTMTFAANGPVSRTITLTAEGLNSDRRRPRFGLLTNADQQARYPGDTALQYRPSLRFKTLVTPW